MTAAATTSTPAASAATSAATASAATRRPRGPDSPQVATAPESASQPRRSAQTRPSLTTTAAATDALQAAVRGRTDQPRPSLSEVARQATAETAADRSQPLANVATASTATQVAAARHQQGQSRCDAQRDAGQPHPLDGHANDHPQILDRISPARGESRGCGQHPRRRFARGGAGADGGDQGDHGYGRGRPGAKSGSRNPAGQTPANLASASARRAESLQNLASGPDLAPQEAALIPRSRAEAERPGAMFQAEPILEIASTSGAREPATLTANASAALTRAESDAAEGPVSAAAGQADVDLGPTQIVSEDRAGRASGGGQPQLNFETASPMLARSAAVGGVPDVSIAADAVSDTPTAPDVGGGMPLVAETEMAPTSVARTDPGAQAPVSGGPTRVAQPGPPAEASLATQIAEVELARAERAEAVPGEAQAGGGDPDEDEEERRRRLARAALAGTRGVETSTRPNLPRPTPSLAARTTQAHRPLQLRCYGPKPVPPHPILHPPRLVRDLRLHPAASASRYRRPPSRRVPREALPTLRESATIRLTTLRRSRPHPA